MSAIVSLATAGEAGLRDRQLEGVRDAGDLGEARPAGLRLPVGVPRPAE